jgi:hypothetical protein
MPVREMRVCSMTPEAPRRSLSDSQGEAINLKRLFPILAFLGMAASIPLFGQSSPNCFLEDFETKTPEIPPYVNANKPAETATVGITVDASVPLGNVSKYLFGNALPSWLGNVTNDAVLVENIRKLSPTLIRYPGGSWADIFFWDGATVGVPDSIYDGTTGLKTKFTWQSGRNSWPTTVDNYYTLRDRVDAQGLITINYGYARYGWSSDPVAQAAHHAADWVRYDEGRTLFWEIGNENDGPWEAGWRIDTLQNKDGQPAVITGEWYGKHFKIFADSMRAAADEIGSTIYIGAQIIHENRATYWNVPDRKWNEGFFQEAGSAADYYVIHNYFGNLNAAMTVPKQMMTFIQQDIAQKGASVKPVALTEWNMDSADSIKTSIQNGMQAVILFSELIKNNYGMSCRWPLANWEADGMFYTGNTASIPKWTPRPDFFYAYYLQKFTGDRAVPASSSNKDILVYATTFSTNQQMGVVIINKGKTGQVVNLSIKQFGVGDRYYVYSLTGEENRDYSQTVTINDAPPALAVGGPSLDDLESISAFGYPVGDEIKVASPRMSVQFVLIDGGEKDMAVREEGRLESPAKVMIYPTPARESLKIDLKEGGYHRIDIVNVSGSVVYSGEVNPALRELRLTPRLSSGYYFVKLTGVRKTAVSKLIICK